MFGLSLRILFFSVLQFLPEGQVSEVFTLFTSNVSRVCNEIKKFSFFQFCLFY